MTKMILAALAAYWVLGMVVLWVWNQPGGRQVVALWAQVCALTLSWPAVVVVLLWRKHRRQG